MNTTKVLKLLIFLLIIVSCKSKEVISKTPIKSDFFLNPITKLPSAIKETSGLIILNDKFITHNDSGGSPNLYEFDKNSGKITRTVTISNAKNVDWEDITHDNTYIYIGDIGNNKGTRKDLKIYKIKIKDYLSSNRVKAEIINFAYKEQTDFSKNTLNTNFDAETIISHKDSLILFTKNWKNNQTDLYLIPKKSGTYTLEKVKNYNVKGLITSGTFNSKNEIYLIGYTREAQTFLIKLVDFNNSNFSRFLLEIPKENATQIEAIAHYEGSYYITSESYLGKNSTLFLLQ